MKTITAYQTTDGQVFKLNIDAEKHQNNIDLKDALDKLMDDKDTVSMFDAEFVEFVMDNRAELLEILKGK